MRETSPYANVPAPWPRPAAFVVAALVLAAFAVLDESGAIVRIPAVDAQEDRATSTDHESGAGGAANDDQDIARMKAIIEKFAGTYDEEYAKQLAEDVLHFDLTGSDTASSGQRVDYNYLYTAIVGHWRKTRIAYEFVSARIENKRGIVEVVEGSQYGWKWRTVFTFVRGGTYGWRIIGYDATQISPPLQTAPARAPVPAPTQQRIWRVHAYGSRGAEDGASWETAFRTLQPAIDRAYDAVTSGEIERAEVWVGRGAYRERRFNDTGSVILRERVDVYGGFAGRETRREERDWQGNVTCIDGGKARDGKPAYHTIIGADDSVFDGFEIVGVDAEADNASSTGKNHGGGMYNDGVSPTVANCVFRGYGGVESGGGVYNVDNAPTIVNCTFERNAGGGIRNVLDSRANIINCRFEKNWGEGMSNHKSSPTVINCIFADNMTDGIVNQASAPIITNCVIARNYRFGIDCADDSNPSITNCIIWDNEKDATRDTLSGATVTHSLAQGGYPGIGNIDADPLFAHAVAGDYRLLPGSPCIDAGTPNGAPETDSRGVPRPQGAGIDMGALEARILDGEPPREPLIEWVRQDWGRPGFGRTVAGARIRIGQQTFEHGLGTASGSHFRVYSPAPIDRFTAWVGITDSAGPHGSVEFRVVIPGRELYYSPRLGGSETPEPVDVATNGAHILDLYVSDGDDGPAADHAAWADPAITLRDGATLQLDEIGRGAIPMDFLAGDVHREMPPAPAPAVPAEFETPLPGPTTGPVESRRWSPRSSHTVVVHEDRLWVLGGYDGEWRNDVWRSRDGVNWTEMTAAAPWSPRFRHASVVFDGRLWVIGGMGPGDEPLNDVWHSTDGVHWIEAVREAPWTGRGAHAPLVYDDKLWLLGGMGFGGYVNYDVWYSEDGVVWHEVTDDAPWGPRWRHGAVVHDQKMWVLGGSGRNDVWYSTDGRDWVAATDAAPWTRREGHGTVVHNGRIWIIGGMEPGEIHLNDVWYSTDGVDWIEATYVAPWSPRAFGAAVIFDDKLWVIGGYGAGFNNDVWHSANGTAWRQVGSSPPALLEE
ncbi:MAG TPA: hypothetical protein HPP77_05300 [Candidatus Hydrogenedentes bacterium]|nr:hypothetical protein [Candidatus Hydrogenedentota bacterium]